MSDATPLDAPFGPEAAGPRGAVRTSALNSAWALFAMTLASQARSRRLLVLALLYTLPIGLAVLIRYQGAGFRGRRRSRPDVGLHGLSSVHTGDQAA